MQYPASLPPWLLRQHTSPLRLLQTLLLALLAVQGVRLAWMLVPPAPIGSADTPATDQMVSMPAGTDFDPFFPQSAVAQASDDTGITLHGISSGPAGASAILGTAEGRQASFRVGEPVQPGIRLIAINPDHVVLEGGAGHRQLAFGTGTPPAPVSRPVPTALPTAASAHTTTPAAIDPARLLEQAGLTPRQIDGKVAGYTLIPRGGGALLRQAGLQAGDVLLSINGQALTPEAYQDLAAQLDGQSSLAITVQRDGATHTVQVPLQ